MEDIGYLTHSGFIVPVSVMRAKFKNNWAAFLKKLTITHQRTIGPPLRAIMYKFATYNGINTIILPRTLIGILLKSGILSCVEVLFAPARVIDAKLTIDLYENQQLIVEHLCGHVFTEARIQAGTATAILNLRAGMGKTLIGGGIIAHLKMRTLYIVPKRPLMLQAAKDLRAAFYGEDSISVGVYGKSTRDPTTVVANQDVTCIVINSALMCDAAFFAGYSIVILDEVHSYCSEQRREIFRKCATHVVLGMTATSEDRGDGFDPIAHKELAFDGIIRAEEVPGFTYGDVLFDCHARIINYCGPPEHTLNLTHEATGRVFTHYMHNQFIGDPYRLQLAVSELIRLYDWTGADAQHYIYVFAEEIEILRCAKTAFAEALLARARDDVVADMDIPECGLEMFTGGLRDEKIVDITNSARVLFSTYSYAGTGISIQKMSAILFLTPRKANMKQILARILRRGSDITIPRIVVDIVDKKTVLKYQVMTRKMAYEHYGFECAESQVKYTDV